VDILTLADVEDATNSRAATTPAAVDHLLRKPETLLEPVFGFASTASAKNSILTNAQNDRDKLESLGLQLSRLSANSAPPRKKESVSARKKRLTELGTTQFANFVNLLLADCSIQVPHDVVTNQITTLLTN